MHTQLEAADHAGLDAAVAVLNGWMSSLAFMPAWVQPAARKPNMFIGPDLIPQKSCCLSSGVMDDSESDPILPSSPEQFQG